MSMQRKDMDPNTQWDLTPIFKDEAEWNRAFAEAEQAVKGLERLPGTLKASREQLKAGLDEIYRVEALAERVLDYAFLSKAVDNGDPRSQEMEARAISLSVALETATAFLGPEILSIPQEQLDVWTADDEFKLYRHELEDLTRSRAHMLDDQRERMMAMLGEIAQNPGNTFDMFESVDMRFPDIHNEAGELVPLTHGSFGVFRECRSQAVRKEAFETYFDGFAKYINTLASIYGGAVKMNCFNASVRGYAGACEAKLFGDNVPVSLYDGLIESVHGALPTMKEYLALRQKALGLETLNLYDLYVPIMEDVEFDMPFEAAKALVKEALKPLGEEYQHLQDRAFEECWIDVYENPGKTTGAFSSGVYGAHPYVLLNYSGKLNDVFTLAHELGHAMHSYFSDREQAYPNHGYRIFVAEVASTVNEVLLMRYLLAKETDAKRKAYLLNHFLEEFRTTVFRQTLFAEFERKAHELCQEGTPLTAQTLNQVFHDLNALYYDGAEINAFGDAEWARIPHFYNAFYVYQYATGYSSAVAIATQILKTGDASDYLRFLTLGGSDYPLEELKVAGVDLRTDATAIEEALMVFKDTLEELKKLL